MEDPTVKEKFNTLRRTYEDRLDSITASVRRVYQSIEADEVGLALRQAPEGAHYRHYTCEVVEAGLAREREEFVQRLADKLSAMAQELAVAKVGWLSGVGVIEVGA